MIKTISVTVKISDQFYADFLDDKKNSIFEYGGYVPDFFPADADGGSHYGDYLMLDIDVETGKIKNWKVPTQEEILKLKGENDETSD